MDKTFTYFLRGLFVCCLFNVFAVKFVFAVKPLPRPQFETDFNTAVSTTGYAYIANQSSNTVSVINLASYALTATIPVGTSPYGVAISPDNSKVYVTNTGSNTISVINTATNTVSTTISTNASPKGIAVTPDGSTLYVSFNEGYQVISAANSNTITTSTLGISPGGIAISADGSRIYITETGFGELLVINGITNATLAQVAVGSSPSALALSSDSKTLYVCNSGSNSVSVINTANNAVTATISVGTNPQEILVRPDDNVVFVTNHDSNVISVINALTNTVSTTITSAAGNDALSIIPDGSQFYVTNDQTNSITVFDAATYAMLAMVNVGMAPYSFGNFIAGTATTQPKLSVSGTLAALSTATGTASASEYFTASAAYLTTGILITAPPGFQVSTDNATFSSTVTLSGSGTIASTKIYLRLAATAPAGTYSGSFILSSNGAKPVNISIAASNVTGAPTPGFAYVANAASNTVSVISLATNAIVATIPVGQYPTGVAVSKDNSRVYVSNSSSSNISVINTATNTVIQTITAGINPTGIAVSPDGTRLYVTYDYPNVNGILVISTATAQTIATITYGAWPAGYDQGLVVSPDGSKVYVANHPSGNVNDVGDVYVINTATNAVTAQISLNEVPFGLTISPDGSRVYVGSDGGTSIAVINTATNRVLTYIGSGFGPQAIAVSPDSKTVYATSNNSNFVYVIDGTNNIVTSAIKLHAPSVALSLSGDGNRLYVANGPFQGTDTVSVINTVNRSVLASATVGSGVISMGTFTTGTITIPSMITAGTVTGTITSCAGTASASPNIQQFTVSGSGLSANVTAAAPSGFEISLTAASGYASTVTLNQTGGVLSNVVVYVRSSAAAAGSLTGNVALSSAGATTQTVAVSATVKALPTVNAVTNQTVVNGTTTTAVNFTGGGNTFTWVNDTPGIGLASGGTGNIPSFTGKNTGSTPVKATITVTPLNESGFAYINNYEASNTSVINIATNKVVATIPGIQSGTGIAISSDGSKAYITNSTSNGALYAINTATNTLASSIPLFPLPFEVCLSPDGTRAYINHDLIQNTLTVVNTQTNSVIADVSLTDSTAYARGICISPDGSKIYVNEVYDSNGRGVVKVFDTTTLTVVDSIPGAGHLAINMAISHDGTKLYITGDSLTVLNINTKTTEKVFLSDPHVSSFDIITVSPDDSKVYTSNNTLNEVAVFNTSNITAPPLIISGLNKPFGLSLTPDGAFLYIENVFNNNVTVFNTITNTKTDSVAVAGITGTIGNFITPGSGCRGTPITFTITVNPSSTTSPAITTTGTLAALTTTAGTASSSTSFTVSGSNLTAGILVTPPAGFEVSTDNTTFSNTVNIAGTGTIASTTVYVRLAAATAAGTYSGNVVLTSTGATTVNMPTAASTVTSPGIGSISTSGTLTALNATYGQSSAPATFTVSGSNLTSGVLVTAPPGYEVSTDGVNFGSTVTVQSTGTLGPTTVYLRLAATTAAGTYAGNVTLTSGGTSVTVATVSSTIAQALLTVTADNKTRPFGAGNPDLTYTYSGFENDDTPSSLTTLPTAVTTATTASPVGTYPITPGGAAAANYTFKYVSGTLTVTTSNVLLVFNPLPAKTYGDPDFDPGASIVTGAAITYTSSNTAVATIAKGMVHITGAGTAMITASVGDTSIKPVTQLLTVNKANQTITFAAIPTLAKGTQYDLSAVTASSTLPVSFTISNLLVASVSGQTLNALTAGTDSLTATQAGNDNYNSVTVTLAFTVDDGGGNALVVHKELSPNGDGINDYLLIDGIQDYPLNTLTVYNRDGVRVAQVEGYDNSGHVFNGRSNYTGALQQAGTYFYVLQYTADASTKKKTGYFVLKYQ